LAAMRRAVLLQRAFPGGPAQEIFAKLAHGRTLALFCLEESVHVEPRIKIGARTDPARHDTNRAGKALRG
jgi:hypothetical protein